ncbi:carotenoid 1,2-hydratase [Actinoplanes sp. TBRC 11911]|uniref:lipocalin-like domain-containing protein n=1 Tax=Actinoplanes sp. TBRC 11911 TaxID=2729386 RepID=UPI00145F90C1|nr:lipocalin-like domain-containing protein [Actinoplanes sp. TBRC 11911]NMO49751.1 carotenoid 1,2-hydratase [Actinoplanes sp. TBRC 11911]
MLSDDYARFGLDPRHVREWEDGARTDGAAGSYEWWYFDAHLDDGAKVVVVFMNKDLGAANSPLSPQLRVDVELPDGTLSHHTIAIPAAEWSAASGRTDVRMGPLNRFRGEKLVEYRVEATAGGTHVDFTLTSDVPAWRPRTGHMLFGERQAYEFNWLPAVPQGTVRGSYTVDGERHETTGIGYHDHNWGNVGLQRIIHDWYWGRGHAGPHTVIASFITGVEDDEIPIFMLARDGRIIGDDPAKLTFERRDVYADGKTGKPVAGVVRYTYVDGDDRYVVSFDRKRDLARNWLVQDLPWLKRTAARLTGFDGAYLRFAGLLTIEHHKGGRLVETFADEAIWELMYFGHAPAQSPA